MPETMSRLMVEVAILQAQKDLRRQFNRRVLRNAIEHGVRYSGNTHSRMVYRLVQEMLRSDDHPYYELCRGAARQVDERYMRSFGVNLGYENWYLGTAALRNNMRRLGCCLPWAISVRLSDADTRMEEEQALALLERFYALGTRCFLLREDEARAALLKTLCAAYADCAFTLDVPDAAVTESWLRTLGTADNALVIPRCPDGQCASGGLLAADHRLRTMLRPYTADWAEELVRGHRTLKEEAAGSLVLFLQPEESCPQTVRDAFAEWLMEKKIHPDCALFPVDLETDIRAISGVVAGRPILVAVSPDGSMTVNGTPCPADAPMPETLRKLCPCSIVPE